MLRTATIRNYIERMKSTRLRKQFTGHLPENIHKRKSFFFANDEKVEEQKKKQREKVIKIKDQPFKYDSSCELITDFHFFQSAHVKQHLNVKL